MTPSRPHPHDESAKKAAATEAVTESTPEAEAVAETAEDEAGVPAELDERYLRLAADFENFRRRKAQELADRARYGSEDAARALLPVLDNLRRAVAPAPEGGAEQQPQRRPPS